MNNLTHIFLFGHRKTMGKDVSCSILKKILEENKICTKHSYFAKMLKQHTADRYGLDFNKMGDEYYKNSRPSHLNGVSVREVFIKEGCFARSIWQNTWAFPMYRELLLSDTQIGLCSDFRFPNEYSCFDECFNIINEKLDLKKPKVIKVLVHRPDGKFVCDGADDQLPDIDPYWDYIIINESCENWKNVLETKIRDILKKEGIINEQSTFEA